MRPFVRFTPVLSVFLVLVLTPAARAFDVTGEWAGTYRCTGTFEGFKDSFTSALGAIITQDGSTLGAVISFDGGPFAYTGIAIADAGKPDKGNVMLTYCGTDDNLGSGVDELARLAVKTNSAKHTGTLSGTSFFSRLDDPQAYTCKWKLKRTTILDAQLPQTCNP